MINSAWWFRTSNKLSGKKSKKQTEKLGNGQFLSGFVQNSAIIAFSRQEDKDGSNKQPNTRHKLAFWSLNPVHNNEAIILLKNKLPLWCNNSKIFSLPSFVCCNLSTLKFTDRSI